MGLNSSTIALDSNLTDLVQSLQAQVTSLANQGQAGINFGTVQSNVGNQGWVQGPYQGLIDNSHSLIISVFIPDWAKHLLRVNLYWKLRAPREATTGAPSSTRLVAAGSDSISGHTHTFTVSPTARESGSDSVAGPTHTHTATALTDAAIPTEQIDLLDSTGVTTYYSSSATTAGPFDLLPYVTNGLLSQPNGYGPITGFTDFKLAVDALGLPTPNLVGIEAWLDIVVIGQPIA